MEGSMPQGEAGGTPNQEQNNQAPAQPSAPSGTSDMKADAKGLVGQLEAMLDEYMVKKAPFTLPMEVKEFIVKVSPYLIIISAVVALPVIFLALGLTAVLTPFAMMGGSGWGYGWGFRGIVNLAVAALTIVLNLMAVSGLFKRTKSSWRLVFYVSIISLVGSILSFNIISGLIGAVIGWYFLFQVKELYKN